MEHRTETYLVAVLPDLNCSGRFFGEEPPKEESRLLLVPKSKAEGITSILNLHKKKFVG